MKNKLQIYTTISLSLITLIIGFSITFFKTQTLTSEEIGVLALFSSIASICNILGLFGFSQSIIKYIPFFNNSDNKKTGFFLFSALVVFMFSTFILIILSIFRTQIINIYDNSLFEQYFYGIYLIIIFSTFTLLIDSVFKIYNKPVISQMITSIIKSFINIMILLAVLIFSLSFKVYFILYVGLLGITLAIQIIALLKVKIFVRPDFSFINKRFIKTMFIFNSFMLFSGITHLLNYQLDSLMIGSILTTVDVGVYSIVIVLGNLVGLSAQGLTRITHSSVSRYIQSGDFKGLEKEYKSIGDFQFLIGLLVFFGIILFSRSFLTFFGEQYSRAYLVAIIIGFGYLIDSLTSFCGGIIGYSNLYKLDIVLELFLLIGNIMLNFILIPLLGINGAAIATSLTLILYNLIKVIVVNKKFRIHPFSLNNFKTIFSALFAVTIIIVINSFFSLQNLFIDLIIKAVIYLSFYAFGMYVQKYENQIIKFNRRK